MPTKSIHYTSGLIITIFITLHLFNHLCSIAGAEAHTEVMNTLRLFYRNIFIETVLLIAVIIQIVSGLILFKTNRKKAISFFEKLHIWSGLYLALFFVIHLGAVFTGRYLLHLDTNFYFGVAGLNTFPVNLFLFHITGLQLFHFGDI